MSETTDKFDLYNTQSTKQVVVAVKIEGVPGLLTSGSLFTRIRYGDPELYYGDPGLIYGGLRQLTQANGGEIQSLLKLENSSLSITQKLEPEQGRASISQLSLTFIDLAGYMTQLASPGIIIPDLLGRAVTVLLGYAEISYPEDFFVIFRGKVSNIMNMPGTVTLALSDPNLGRRQQIFYTAKTQLASTVLAAATTIPVASNGDFHKHILGPDGAYDPSIRLFMKIEDEFIEYGPTATLPGATFGVNTFTGVTRGARGTLAVDHDAGEDVAAVVEITGHAIDLALKLMLSGFNGSYRSGVSIQGLVSTGDPLLGDQASSIILPRDFDAVRDYGLSAGDYITITGDAVPANNLTTRVVRFEALQDQPNRLIYTEATFTPEASSVGLLSFRSQYDTFPVSCGSKISAEDVDVDRHLFIKNTFLSAEDNKYQFLIQSPESSCKTFLEKEVYLPIACYSLTRQGRLSVGLTKAPIADSKLQILTEDNILNAQQLSPSRGVSNRKFYNELNWEYDENDEGTFLTQFRQLDVDSLSIIGLSSVLPIQSRGAKTAFNVLPLIQKRTAFLLSRYKKGAVEINPKVNYEVGIQIEAGDVVGIKDNGTLQIPNYETGERDLGVRLFEVTERTLDILSGNVSLKVISGIGSEATDRFGTISPSSVVVAGSTVDDVMIQDSFGAIFPGNEQGKWEDYFGEQILVRSEDWGTIYQTTLIGFDPANAYRMLVSPSLPAAPPAGFIVDIITYPDTPNVYDSAIYKQIHTFLTPNVPIVSAASDKIVTVGVGDIAKFFVGGLVQVHEPDWTYYSPESEIVSIDVGIQTLTLKDSLGFTPSALDEIELIGFPDKGGPYRFI